MKTTFFLTLAVAGAGIAMAQTPVPPTVPTPPASPTPGAPPVTIQAPRMADRVQESLREAITKRLAGSGITDPKLIDDLVRIATERARRWDVVVPPRIVVPRAPLTEEHRKRIEESMERARKILEENRTRIVVPPTPRLDRRDVIRQYVRPNVIAPRIDYLRSAAEVSLDIRKVHEMIASLTPAQRELARKQGYLRSSDLTDAQREMLGSLGRQDLRIYLADGDLKPKP